MAEETQTTQQSAIPEVKTAPAKEQSIDIGKEVLDYRAPSRNDSRGESSFEGMWGKLPNVRWKNVGRMVQLKVFTDDSTVDTGDGKLIWMVPPELDGVTLVRVVGFVTTVSSSGALTIQLRNITQSVDVLSTVVTIDQSENTSLTAATAPVIKAAHVLRSGDLLAIDVDGAGIGAKGLGVHLSLI